MQEGIQYDIRPLCANDCHRKFKTGHVDFLPLKTFIKNDALQYQDHLIAQTYVAVGSDGSAHSGRIMAYITVTCSEIDITDNYAIENGLASRYYNHMPAVKIARLATDTAFQGNGLATELILLVIALVQDTIIPATGCRFLVVDSKHKSVDFYQRFGFQLLDEKQLENPEGHPLMFIDMYDLRPEIAENCKL